MPLVQLHIGSSPSTPRLPRARLRLESLEDRCVPATFAVTTKIDIVDPSDGLRSLREAITQANATTGVADVIVLPAGLFKLALPGAGENGNATGDYDITDSLTIRGAGAGITIIDGQQLDRVFEALGTTPSSIRLVLDKVTVRNGNQPIAGGGGIRFANADLVVRDSIVTANRAIGDGGGISNAGAIGTGDVSLIRSLVSRNVAGANGGGVYAVNSSLTMTNSTVRRNVASLGDGGGVLATSATVSGSTISGNTSGNGGGGLAAGTATVTGCTISGNTAASLGGGLYVEQATVTDCTISRNASGNQGGGMNVVNVTLTRCTIADNTAMDDGGGIYSTSATVTSCTISDNAAADLGGGWWTDQGTMTRSTVSGNRAGTFGGGILAEGANLTNCTISGNTARDSGGGVAAEGGTLLNCTVVENIAGAIGGGLFHMVGSTFSVRNSIVALNLDDFAVTGPDVAGIFVSLGHNLIGESALGTGFLHGVNGDQVGDVFNPIDPKLGPLKNNGGRTKTHALLAGSSAIDRGDNVSLPPTDQRGLPRIKDGNANGVAVVDIGAFEK